MEQVQGIRTVREAAVNVPGATRVFEQLGIDYCCGGNQPLDIACAQKGVDLNALLRTLTELESAQHAAPTNADYRSIPLERLIAHIVNTHHAFTRSEIDRLDALFEKVVARHGENHPELIPMQRIFRELAADLLPHLLKEEQVLFPYVLDLERATTTNQPHPTPFFGTIRNPVRMMSNEHENAGALLESLRKTANQYATPDGACTSYQALLDGLQDLERDLHEHIHLENNILFPRAIAIE